MGVVQVTPQGEIDAFMERAMKRNERAVESVLFQAGEMAQNSSRLHGDYKDQTGNLRASVGYTVSKDGNVLNTGGFVPGGGSERGSKGVVEGSKAVAEKASAARGVYALTVVAGMDYAEYVERRGYNVLSSGEREADEYVGRRLKRV
jgi:hypothetical protein